MACKQPFDIVVLASLPELEDVTFAMCKLVLDKIEGIRAPRLRKFWANPRAGGRSRPKSGRANEHGGSVPSPRPPGRSESTNRPNGTFMCCEPRLWRGSTPAAIRSVARSMRVGDGSGAESEHDCPERRRHCRAGQNTEFGDGGVRTRLERLVRQVE